jgi:hypothetical protein
LVWLSSVILLCGGGLYSAAAIMWAMAAECFTEERRQVFRIFLFLTHTNWTTVLEVRRSTTSSLGFMLRSLSARSRRQLRQIFPLGSRVVCQWWLFSLACFFFGFCQAHPYRSNPYLPMVSKILHNYQMKTLLFLTPKI